VLLAATEPDDVYETHVNLIRHGRRICSARAPACRQCPLVEICPYGRRAVGRRG
jgi:endonuclease-3